MLRKAALYHSQHNSRPALFVANQGDAWLLVVLADNMADELSQKQIDLLVYIRRRLTNLPLLPMVVSRLFSLDPEDEDYFDQVLRLAEEDPSFAVRVLRLSNTAANSPRKHTIGLQGSLARVGTRQIEELIKEMSVTTVFMPSTRDQRILWIHSAQVAVAARTIAALDSKLGVEPETAYLCGLLHDVGRFVLFENSVDDLATIDATGWKTLEDLLEAENQVVGLSHAEIGYRAAQKWRLPDFVTDVIRNHHIYTEPDNSMRKVKPDESLMKIVQVADFLSVIMIEHPKFLKLDDEAMVRVIMKRCIPPAWNTPPVSPMLLQKRVRKIYAESSEIAKDLGLRLD